MCESTDILTGKYFLSFDIDDIATQYTGQIIGLVDRGMYLVEVDGFQQLCSVEGMNAGRWTFFDDKVDRDRSFAQRIDLFIGYVKINARSAAGSKEIKQ